VALITRSKKEIEKAFSKLENSGQKNNLESVKYFEYPAVTVYNDKKKELKIYKTMSIGARQWAH
jgi:CMP-N-acetylneuraminic acid synthetase